MKRNIKALLTLCISVCLASAGICSVSAENIETADNAETGSEEILYGDVNSDGVLNSADFLMFQKWLIGSSDDDLSEIKAADMNDDGKVSIIDLCLLKSSLLEESENFKSEPAVPVSPVTQTVDVQSMDDLIYLLKNYDPDDYYSGYRDSLEDMFMCFNRDGYVYHYSEYKNSDEKIELCDIDSPVVLLPYYENEDSGIYYNVTFEGKRYQIRYYFTDPEYSGADMEQYIEKRLGQEHDGVQYNSYVFSKFKCGDKYDPVAYCMLDEEHYCEVRSYDTTEDLVNILKVLRPEKKLIYAPVLEIEEGINEDEGYIWNLITEDGGCYSVPYAIFASATEEDVLQYIISEGKKESFTEDEEIRHYLADISKNIDEYSKSEWTSLDYEGTVYSDYSFSLYYNDGDGNLKQLYFCYIKDGKVQWRDNEQLQNFVKLLVEREYIKADEFWNCIDDEGSVMTDISDQSAEDDTVTPE